MDTNATTSSHGLAAHRPAVSAKPPRSAHLLPSVFHDLPGPELYDPSWYSNKLRAECGRLDTRHPTATSTSTATSPVLPKSYHVRPDNPGDDDSDDTDDDDDDDDDEDDEDDDSEAPTTLLSSDVPLTNATLDSDLDVHMRTPSSPTKHRSSLQPDDLLNKPRIINNDDDDFPASVKNHSIDILPSPVSVAHHHHHLQHATSGRLASYMHSPSQPQSTHRFSPTVSVADATSSTPRKGLRFSRRSMFGFNIDSPSPSSSTQLPTQRHQNIYPQYEQQHHHHQQHQQYQNHQQIVPQQQQQPDGLAGVSGQVNKRHSKMFRASRLFGHGGGSSNVERHKTAAPAAEETQYRDDYPKQSLSRSLLRRSVVGASKVASTGAVVGSSATHFITSGFGRRSVVFHWPIAPLETLYKLRMLLENRFAAIATGLKTDELRMQVPLHQPSYTPLPANNQGNGGKAATACAVVIAVDENRDGSRVLLRRSLRDTFHGGSDEFEWLCAQITEQLRQFHPGIRMFYP